MAHCKELEGQRTDAQRLALPIAEDQTQVFETRDGTKMFRIAGVACQKFEEEEGGPVWIEFGTAPAASTRLLPEAELRWRIRDYKDKGVDIHHVHILAPGTDLDSKFVTGISKLTLAAILDMATTHPIDTIEIHGKLGDTEAERGICNLWRQEALGPAPAQFVVEITSHDESTAAKIFTLDTGHGQLLEFFATYLLEARA